MAVTQTAEVTRAFASGISSEYADHLVVASTTVYQGQALCAALVETAGLVKPFDNALGLTSPFFVGFAETSVTQTATSTFRVKVRVRGRVLLTAITGADSADDLGKTVYASNDATFTLTSTNNVAIGKIVGYSSEGFDVQFEGTQVASV